MKLVNPLKLDIPLSAKAGIVFAIVMSVIGGLAYYKHTIKEEVVTQINLDTAKTVGEVQNAKAKVRNKPVTGNDVVVSLQRGVW